MPRLHTTLAAVAAAAVLAGCAPAAADPTNDSPLNLAADICAAGNPSVVVGGHQLTVEATATEAGCLLGLISTPTGVRADVESGGEGTAGWDTRAARWQLTWQWRDHPDTSTVEWTIELLR